MNIITTDAIARLNSDRGLHWFDADSMRFFASRVASFAYVSADGKKAFFVSSEKFKGFRAPDGPRLYSVRVASLDTGDINAYPDHNAFQAYKSRSGADAAARRFAMVEQQ